MPYTQTTVTDYNSSPPTDDGATDVINRATWSGIKTKLGDPIKVAIEAIDDNIPAAVDGLDADIAEAIADIAAASAAISSDTTALSAPAATELFFVQTAAPTGWTKITTYNDYALRLVSGTPSTGGTTAFTTIFTNSRTISTAMPAHTHTLSTITDEDATIDPDSFTFSVSENSVSNRDNGGVTITTDANVSTSSFSGQLSFSGTTSSQGSGTGMDFDVQYVDVILASKDA